jgi:hypothetical protein
LVVVVVEGLPREPLFPGPLVLVVAGAAVVAVVAGVDVGGVPLPRLVLAVAVEEVVATAAVLGVTLVVLVAVFARVVVVALGLAVVVVAAFGGSVGCGDATAFGPSDGGPTGCAAGMPRLGRPTFGTNGARAKLATRRAMYSTTSVVTPRTIHASRDARLPLTSTKTGAGPSTSRPSASGRSLSGPSRLGNRTVHHRHDADDTPRGKESTVAPPLFGRRASLLPLRRQRGQGTGRAQP